MSQSLQLSYLNLWDSQFNSCNLPDSIIVQRKKNETSLKLIKLEHILSAVTQCNASWEGSVAFIPH